MVWTVERVEAMLVEAADTLRRLPRQRPRGFFSTMPTPVRSLQELLAAEPVPAAPAPASPAAIDRLDQVLAWSRWLTDEQVRVVWARASGVPWRPLCRRLGCGRTKAWRIWVTALVVLTARLNEAGTPVPPCDA